MRKLISLPVIIFILFCVNSAVFALDNKITVYCGRKKGKVNRNVFGTNFIGYDPSTYENRDEEYYGYSDYAAGVWDPGMKKPVQEVIDLAISAGTTTIRFPGGCGTHAYNWKNAVNTDRQHFLYGIDEFLNTCEAIKAEPVLTVSYFTGDEKDAADLVEYLNAPYDGSNPNQGTDWAKLRAENGHPQPYGVRFFEIGNEVWHGNHREIKKVLPEEYAFMYKKYYEAMKEVDPSVKIGVLLCGPDWNAKVTGIIKEKMDFGILHIYPSPEVPTRELSRMEPEDIYSETMAVIANKYEKMLLSVSQMLNRANGKITPLAITEYNGGFIQQDPLPYRHCLGTALVNAELIRVFLEPQNNVLMAHYWQFCNSFWGMVYTKEDFMQHDYSVPIQYYKRPNYYVFELYKNYFGDELLETSVTTKSYISKRKSGILNTTIKKIKELMRKNGPADYELESDEAIGYISAIASMNKNQDRVYLMVINKNMRESVPVSIELKDFTAHERVKVRILNNQSVTAMNEKGIKTCGITHKEASISSGYLELTLGPHSLNSIEIIKEGSI